MSDLKKLQKLFVDSTKELIKIIRAEEIGENCYFFSEKMRSDCIISTLENLRFYKKSTIKSDLKNEILINENIKRDIYEKKHNYLASTTIQ